MMWRTSKDQCVNNKKLKTKKNNWTTFIFFSYIKNNWTTIGVRPRWMLLWQPSSRCGGMITVGGIYQTTGLTPWHRNIFLYSFFNFSLPNHTFIFPNLFQTFCRICKWPVKTANASLLLNFLTQQVGKGIMLRRLWCFVERRFMLRKLEEKDLVFYAHLVEFRTITSTEAPLPLELTRCRNSTLSCPLSS